jgi:endonuclease III
MDIHARPLENVQGKSEGCMDICAIYLDIKRELISDGFGDDINWRKETTQRPLESITESNFIEQVTWVALTSGFSEKTVEAHFDAIAAAFNGFSSAKDIIEHAEEYLQEALKQINHRQKMSAPIKAAQKIDKEGFAHFMARVKLNPLKVLQELYYIGPTTAYHLAINIGFQLAKPDVHLTRIMNACGYNDVQEFCGLISKATGDPVPIVDFVLWLYARDHPGYWNRFKDVSPCSANTSQQTF